jgi:AcrR family transcriptional regulator
LTTAEPMNPVAPVTNTRTAAIELFLDRGYDQVTIAEIAERAGLRKRSFFRYFADKREVLFGGAAAFEQGVVRGVLDAPAETPPLEAVIASLTAAGGILTSWGEPVRQRQRVIETSSELHERELIKMASLATALASTLVQRGLDDLPAILTAQAGIVVFATAFTRWAAAPDAPRFPELMRDSLKHLRTAVHGRRFDHALFQYEPTNEYPLLRPALAVPDPGAAASGRFGGPANPTRATGRAT